MSGDELSRLQREDADRPPREAAGPERGVGVGEALRLLSVERRRTMLRYLLYRPEERVTVDDLVEGVVAAERSTDDRGRERISIDVEYIQLPCLIAAGLVAYDADTRLVTYRGDDDLETLLQCVDSVFPDSA